MALYPPELAWQKWACWVGERLLQKLLSKVYLKLLLLFCSFSHTLTLLLLVLVLLLVAL